MKSGMSFVVLYTKTSFPWIDYKCEDAWFTEEFRQSRVPRALILNRSDGKLGFPGGSMDTGETPSNAAIRELFEETSIILKEEDLELLCEHISPNGHTIHCFAYETTFDVLCEYRRQVEKGQHADSEIAGCFLAHMIEYSDKSGFAELLKNNFSGTCREELQILYDKIQV